MPEPMLDKPPALAPFHGVAVDQGSGLAAAIARARGTSAQPDDLETFKRAVVRNLSPEATALLVDAEYGPGLLGDFAPDCARLLAYEADVYLISEGDRITRLPENLSIADYPGLGVRRLKFFMYYAPRGSAEINGRKHDLVERLGADCARHGLEFLFEPIVYDEDDPQDGTPEALRGKPDLVREATQVFADPRFGVDILKVELPVDLARVEGFGDGTFSRDWACDALRHAAEPAGKTPLVYLSGGVSFEMFEASLVLAREAGVNAAGFMCGRAIWSDAIAPFGRGGIGALYEWLDTEGRARLSRLKKAHLP